MQWAVQDLRYGARLLGRRPGFSAFVAVTVALGIGANTAIFSVVDAVLLRPLPFRDPDRVAVLWEQNPAHGEEHLFVSAPNFEDWKAQNTAVERMAAVQNLPVNLTGPGAEPEEVPAQRVSADLFPLLGVPPLLGRGIAPEEDRPGHNHTAVLSYALWKRRFGGDPAVIGKSVRISDYAWTVVGVMPPEFRVLNEPAELWLPLALDPGARDERARAGRNLIVLARLKPGVTVARAQSEFAAIARRLEAEYPRSDSGWTVAVLSLRDELVGDYRPALLVVLAAVGLVLLIACANAGNLLLARSVGRHPEVAVRCALGAGRSRIVWQFLAESLWLALAGGALGLALAWGGVRLLASAGPPDIPHIGDARVDARVFLFTLAVSVTAALVFGIAPAVAASRAGLAAMMSESARGSSGGRFGRRMRDLLLVCEIALALVLLTGAGLMLESFRRLRAVDPGFEARGVLTARLLLSPRSYPEERRIAFFEQALARLRALPGAQAASAVSSLPVAGLGAGGFFSIAGRPAPPAGDKPMALIRAVEPHYFETMRVRRLAGRPFDEHDTREAGRVVIVNETLARRFWPDRPARAVGERLVLEARVPVPAEIVGVVADVKSEGLNSPPWATIYAPHTQMVSPSMALVIRTAGDPLSLAPAVAREIHAVDAALPLAEVRSMEQVLGASLRTRRFQTALLAGFAAMALALAAIGIYGLAACVASERTREIGIRMAVGAGRADVLRMVLRRAALLAGGGIGLGMAGALAVTRLIRSLLFDVGPSDPRTYAATAAVLGAVALLASYLPARRAARIDPVAALRYQ